MVRQLSQTLLPPSAFPEKRTVILDLDNTIIFARQLDTPPDDYDFSVEVGNRKLTYYVTKRPGLDKLLEVASKEFEIVVFTSGAEAYASPILDRLDPKGTLISHRLFLQSCNMIDGKPYKDLSALGREMERVVIFDDIPACYLFQSQRPKNVIRMLGFVGDQGDEELERVVLRFLSFMAHFEDTRVAVHKYKKRCRALQSESVLSEGKSPLPPGKKSSITLQEEEKNPGVSAPPEA